MSLPKRRVSDLPALLALFSTISILLGVLLGEPKLVLAALAAAPYLFITGLLPTPHPHISLQRRFHPPRVLEGSDVTVSLQIENRGAAELELEVVDELPQGLRLVRGGSHYALTLPGLRSARVDYVVHAAEPGLYFFERVAYRSMHPFGVAESAGEWADGSYLVVLPRAEVLRRRASLPRPRNLKVGLHPSRAAGLGVEFFGLRDYAEGDDYRRINWKASARSPRLISNEYEWEKPLDGYLIFDARQWLGPALVEAKRLVASLLVNLMGGRNRLGLIIFSHTFRSVEPEMGRKHLLRLLEMTAEARPQTAEAFTLQAQRAYGLVLRHRQAIVVTPLLDRGMTELLGRLRAAGVDPIVIAVTPRGIGEGPEAALFELARANSLEELARYGVRHIEWRSGEPFVKVLEGIEWWRRGA
jgi:uncharacterized protein (DUF58 family)